MFSRILLSSIIPCTLLNKRKCYNEWDDNWDKRVVVNNKVVHRIVLVR
jgi:hypothetical protein